MSLHRECLPVPLVYVLGNTIWPQVLSICLKPSVSIPILIVSRVSSRLASPLIIRAMWKRQCLDWSERESWRGTPGDGARERERRVGKKNVNKPDKGRGSEWVTEWENVGFLWNGPLFLVPLMNCEEGDEREGPRQNCLCCIQERENKRNRFMSYRKSPRFAVSHPLWRSWMLWLLINRQLLWVHLCTFVCIIHP